MGGRHRVWARGSSCAWAMVSVSVLLVRVIPCHMEWDWSRLLASRGPVGLQQDIQAQRLGWGAQAGQADGMGSGAGP